MRRLKEGLHKWRRERSPFGVQERGCVLFVGTGLCCINVRERECVLFLGVVQRFFLDAETGECAFFGKPTYVGCASLLVSFMAPTGSSYIVLAGWQ